MRLLLALALAMGSFAAPAAAHDNPARDLTRTGIPGAVVLSHDGIHASGNVRADDRFRVGSITKTFVSAVVLQLVAERRLSLDEPVPEAGGVPLRMLLNHTSGIYNHSDDPRVFEHGLLTRWKPRELVAISREHPPYFAPGAGFHYSNTNYVLLGLVIERVTGRPLKRRAGTPLCASCATRPTTSRRTCARLAPGPRQNTSWAGASGALVSTARDLDRFYRALLRSPVGCDHADTRPRRRPVRLRPLQGACELRRVLGPQWRRAGLPRPRLHGWPPLGRRTRHRRRRCSERQDAAVIRALDRALCA